MPAFFVFTVIASEAKQSMLSSWSDGLLRPYAPRNDEILAYARGAQRT
jgi:hypothetical protein